MKNLLNKIIQLVQQLSNANSISNIKFSQDELHTFMDLKNNFNYLVCYPDENSFTNADTADKIIKQNTVFKDVYFMNSKSFNELFEKRPDLIKKLEQNGYASNPIPHDQDTLMINYDIYEKVEDFIYKYTKIEPNSNMLINLEAEKINRFDPYIKLVLPLELKGAEKDTLLSKGMYTKRDNIYSFSGATFEDYLCDKSKAERRRNQRLFNYKLAIRLIHYVEVDDKLVLKEPYDTGYYNIVKDLQQYQSQVLIFNKEGVIADNRNVTSGAILHDMRTETAHHNIYNYAMMEQSKSTHTGKVFLLEKRAVVLSMQLFSTLAHITKLNYISSKDMYNYIYAPKKTKYLTTHEDCEQYVNSLRQIRIICPDDINIFELDALVEHYADSYTGDIDGLKDYLTTNLQSYNRKLSVEIHRLDNNKLLLKKLTGNPFFFQRLIKQKDFDGQLNFVKSMFNEFYGFSLTQQRAMLPNGKSCYINVCPNGLAFTMDNLEDVLDGNTTTCRYYATYSDELYITLCSFLVYTNLIYNNFDQDLDPSKSTLSKEEMQKLENKLDNLDMSMFKMENKNKKGHDKEEIPDTLPKKKKVISSIRNTIAHFGLQVRFSRTEKPENNILIFKYKNSPNQFSKISCKDFLKFITNDLFTSYKPYNYNLIKVSNFKDLIDKVTVKID